MLVSVSELALRDPVQCRPLAQHHPLHPSITRPHGYSGHGAGASDWRKNSPAADASSGADAAALQKKATQGQARIHANKDDRDQLMTAVKTNEGTHWPNKFFSEMDSPLKIWKMRRLPFGSAEER